MESEECTPSRPRYDISMSRRTRKPSIIGETNHDDNGGEIDRKSLKELIDDGDHDQGKTEAKHEDEVIEEERSSLGQHFTREEKHLQLVGVQQKEVRHQMKLRKMVTRYAKVLSHLIKKNRESSLKESQKKKPILKFTL